MTTYCMKCSEPTCTFTETTPEYGLIGLMNCPFHDAPMKRDWKREAVGIGSGVRASRETLSDAGYRELFLPSAKDYAGPGDPTGQKGLREWREEHTPVSKRPVEVELEKTQF